MNANKLADAMQGVISVLCVHNEENCLVIANEAQFMLRQQQAEIEALKAKTLTDEEYDNIFANGKRLGVLETEDRFRNAMNLTDEEITEVLNDENIAEYHQGNWLVLPYAFAKAILRKAQEK